MEAPKKAHDEFLVKLVKPKERETAITPKVSSYAASKGFLWLTPLTGKQKKDVLVTKPKKLPRSEIKQLGLYAIPHNTIKYSDALPLHKLWCEYMNRCLSMYTIPEVTSKRYDTIVSELLKAELNGAKIGIVRSKQSSVVGMKGIVVLETKCTFKIVSKDNKLRTIAKNESLFEVYTKNTVFTVFGKCLLTRPAERSVRKMKSFPIPDL